MGNETAMVQPTGRIVLDNQGIHHQTKKVETATNVYPGRLLEKGTNDDDVVVCGGSNPAVGWAGYEGTVKKHRPATIDTIYAQNAQIDMVNGPGIVILASIPSGQTVVKGEILTFAAAGELTVATAGTHHVVATAEESKSTTSGSVDILVRSLI